jgi:hypothetical protein
MKSLHRPNLLATTLVLSLGALITTASQAGEVYGQVGLPGVGLGYAQPLNPSFTVRGDFVTLGSHEKTTTESGINYVGKLKASRVGVFGDWFPFSGVFRLTGGVTLNNFKFDLDASGSGGTLNVGGQTYGNANDGLNVLIEFPKTTPYLGIGWGHQAATGMRFAADLGASIGRATVTAVGRGQLASPSAQADIDREMAELRDGVGKIRVLPQISVSVGYSF